MSPDDFLQQLVQLDLSERPEEVDFRRSMVELLESGADCFSRHCFPAHFTGSALVVSADGQEALLNHHRKLGRWMQFGGHCDPGETVLAAAQREALEESGLEGLILASPRPFDLDIHRIPARGDQPEHWHYDVRYVLIAPEGSQAQASEESVEVKWFTPDAMEALELDSGSRRLLFKWRKLLARRSGQGAHSRT
jgi:8-oxo-dGTP pyrophosphatase MutT (NUDIX family)